MNLLLALLLITPVSTDSLRIEAEDAELFGVTVETAHEGYSGTGYVTGFDAPGDSLRFEVETGEGIYGLYLGMAASATFASVNVWIDGEASVTTPFGTGGSFAERKLDAVYLTEGTHTITFGGDIDVDYLELLRQTYEAPTAPASQLSDAEATEATRALYQFLLDQYGEHILAGQSDVYQGTPRVEEIAYVEDATGREPAIGAFDLIEYSPGRIEQGGVPNSWSERWIEWSRPDEQGNEGIVNLMWHWNAPTGIVETDPETGDPGWWGGFYTRNMTFDFGAALADPSSEEYDLLLRDIDAIAEQLQKFEDADVPVLWRPLHEAAGGWFWWGAQGAEPFVELWRLMYDRLVDHHDIHNLIWVYTHEPNAIEWYPGDAYVDIVGRDVYASSQEATMKDDWDQLQELYGDRKLIALTETGTVPDPDVITAYGIWWSWFAPWTGDFIHDIDQDYLRRVYTSETVLTRDELPDWRPDPGLGIVSFSAEPPEIEVGQESTLSWMVTGATTVMLDDAPVGAEGTSVVSPDTTTTYTLAAADAEGATDTTRVTVAVLDPTEINRARMRPTVASTEEACCGPVLAADLAVDGDPDTRWSSEWQDGFADDDPDDEWLYVHLGDTYDLHEIVLDWEAAYGEDYDIEVSYGAQLWTTVSEVRGSDGGVDTLRFTEGKQPTARFVRMRGITRATEWGYSLWEFAVYGLQSDVSPPLVEFTEPHEGAFVEPGTDVAATVEASDEDGGVQHVSFYLDGDSLTTVDAAPYTVALATLPEGVHEVTAVATDDEGNRVMAAPFVLYARETGDFRRFEAEEASYSGSVTEVSDSEVSGGAYLDMSGNPENGTITFDEIQAPEAGDYLVAFGYNLPYDSPKSQFVIVNGDTLSEVRFNGAANTWLERGLVVPLQEGANTLAIDWSWGWMYFDYVAIEGVTSTTTDDEGTLPQAVTLGESYPNPFVGRTTLPLALPDAAHVRLEVFDITGRRVAVLLDGMQAAGRHNVPFDADGLASGVYVVRLVADNIVRTRPVVLMQ